MVMPVLFSPGSAAIHGLALHFRSLRLESIIAPSSVQTSCRPLLASVYRLKTSIGGLRVIIWRNMRCLPLPGATLQGHSSQLPNGASATVAVLTVLWKATPHITPPRGEVELRNPCPPKAVQGGRSG